MMSRRTPPPRTDPLLAADARDVFEALAAVPEYLPLLHQLAVPTLSGVLASPDRQGPMLVESTLDLLGGLLKPAAVAEARAAHAACFRHIVALAMGSDDVGMMVVVPTLGVVGNARWFAWTRGAAAVCQSSFSSAPTPSRRGRRLSPARRRAW